MGEGVGGSGGVGDEVGQGGIVGVVLDDGDAHDPCP